jgi:hypothetical protein
MTEFPTGILMVIVLAMSAGVISMLHVFSCVMKHEVTLHDLRNRVEKLHNDYALQLARMSGEIPHADETNEIVDETSVDTNAQGAQDEKAAAIAAPIEQPETQAAQAA